MDRISFSHVRNILFLNLFFVFVLSVASTAQANYCFSSLDVPDATNTKPFGINDSGIIVGSYIDATTQEHGFLSEGGNFTTIDYPGATFTRLYGISNSGQIVGMAGPTGTVFLYKGGNFTPVNVSLVSGALIEAIGGVNDSGEISGTWRYSWGEGGSHGFYTGWSWIDYPHSNTTWVYGINNSRSIVGWYGTTTGLHGFLYAGGEFTTIDFPGAIWGTAAYGISNSGNIVGQYYDAESNNLGFLYAGGEFTSINVPGAYLTSPQGVNDFGDIVGIYGATTGGWHGFIATPDATLTVSMSGTGGGTVASEPAGIDCGSDCSEYFNCGTVVTLIPTPTGGAVFTGWSGACSGPGTCTITMDANKTVTANFDIVGPDLTGEWLSPSQICKKGKCKVTLTLNLENSGNRDASSTSVKVYISDDAVPDAGDVLLKELSIKNMVAGGSWSKKVKATVLEGQTKYLIAVIDPENSVTETVEANNQIVYGPIP